ncbi:hypothetical protein [Ruania alba]|uniref:DUF2975 domain-containing protein n=1 Tax=Ruania alba TaxID=648782 RepID=A0A1H5KPT0_9MICO|nr:hypothetical protein [Ruania alba]SEE66825.1 hypothetical protein SAMN04488554_2383 [Ruania alba]
MNDTPPAVSRADRIVLIVVAAGAALIALAALVGLAVGTIETTTATALEIDGLELANPSSPEFLATAGQVSEARYQDVTLTLTDPPAAVRAFTWAARLCAALVTAGVAGSVAWLAWRTASGRPFVRSARVAVTVAAIVMIRGGLFGDLFSGLARAETVTLLDADRSGTEEGFLLTIFESDFASVGWGLTLAVIATVLMLGERMQKDTEGLV